MVEGIGIIINGVWGILSISIPVSDTISFTLWQYILFIYISCHFIKLLFRRVKQND